MVPHDDFEDIRNLKADYFLHVDAKRWSSLRALFHADARFVGFPFPAADADGFVRGVSGFLEGVESVHQGFMPRLAVTGDGGIRAIWSMHDYLVWVPDSRPYRGAKIPDSTESGDMACTKRNTGASTGYGGLRPCGWCGPGSTCWWANPCSSPARISSAHRTLTGSTAAERCAKPLSAGPGLRRGCLMLPGTGCVRLSRSGPA